MSKAKHNVISYAKVNLDRLGFTDLESTERVPSQDIGYIRYDHPKNGERQFDIQTPEIKMDAGGIPDKEGPGGQSYYKTTASRAFVKIPLEVNPNVKGETEEERETRKEKLTKFKETLEQLDKYMEDNKEKFFGSAKTAKKYTYQPIVRYPQTNDDNDSDEEDGSPDEEVVTAHKPPYMKAKIPIIWDTDNVDLEVFRVNDESSQAFEEDGKWSKITDIETLEDLRKHVGYMRNVKFVLHACKYWAQKQASNGSSTRMYGLTFKVRRVEVKPYTKQSEDQSEDDGQLFEDSDAEDDEVVTKFVEKEKVNVEDSDEDSDEDEEEEEEEKIVVEKKKPVRRSKKASA